MYRVFGYVLLVLGLLIFSIGIIAILTDPPRIISYHYTIRVPYTAFEEVPPGYHNYTETLFTRSASIGLDSSGENATRINVREYYDGGCNYTKLVLHLFGEGLVTSTSNGYVNVSIYYVLGNNESLLDSISIPIRGSELVTPTPTTYTTRSGETITITTPSPTEKAGYEVRSIHKYITGTVAKTDIDQIKVIMTTPGEGILLPQNTSEIMVKASTNTQGKIRIGSDLGAFCIRTYYIDKPLYKPKTFEYTYSIPVITSIDLGSLTTTLTLSLTGLMLILLSLVLIIYGYFMERPRS